MDVLADVLRALRLRGTVYFHAEFRAPWGMDLKAGGVANFHIVTRGHCYARWQGHDQALRLAEGDLVVFPHGTRHSLVHDAKAPAVPAPDLLASRRDDRGTPTFGGDGTATSIICGHFECERAGLHPLLAALPEAIHVSTDVEDPSGFIATATQLAVMESSSGRQGGEAVVDRIAEALLIQVIRAYAEGLRDARGFLAALSDPSLQGALAQIHEQPSHAWTMEELARHAGMSRTVFAERFRDALGTTPMQYVTDWRMHKARELLQSTDATIADVADRVGYGSQWAFAKAFKRVFGTAPGQLRRHAD